MIHKKLALTLLTVFFITMTACSQNDYGDLESFIVDAGRGLQGKVEPVPEVKFYQHFTYQAFDTPNPFSPRKTDQANSAGNGIKPDLNRRKEALEAYTLESLSMVGTLQQDNKIYALIKSPDGTLYRVNTGNYLGQNFGRIDTISDSEVELIEIVQGGANEWIERVSTLMLKN